MLVLYVYYMYETIRRVCIEIVNMDGWTESKKKIEFGFLYRFKNKE